MRWFCNTGAMDSGFAAARRPGMTIAVVAEGRTTCRRCVFCSRHLAGSSRKLLFLRVGRLGPKACVIAVIVVDAAGASSQWLTVPGATANKRLLLFAVVQ